MQNIKINVEDYTPYGLGDIYYGLISFISNYVNVNYNPMEVYENENSDYAIAIVTMKEALKEVLDYLKENDEVYIPKLNKIVKLSALTSSEQSALEERCKEYLLMKLNYVLDNELEKKESKWHR